MSKTKIVWRVAFLGVTATAIVMELIAAWDPNPDTEPWTHLIVRYIPSPIAMAVIVFGGKWTYDHFFHEYRKRGLLMDYVKVDARNRSLRTVLQGAVATVLIAAVTAAIEVTRQAITNDQANFKATLTVAGMAALTAGLTALLSYLHRTMVDASPVPSAPPPMPPPGAAPASVASGSIPGGGASRKG